MNALKTMAILAALAGCAGAQTNQRREPGSGRWTGAIDGNGWTQPLSFDLERQNGIWRGEWGSVVGAPIKPLEHVDVQGDEVRFETNKLRFVGHVSGSTLSGTVSQKAANAAAVGEFSVVQDIPAAHSPASEPSFPLPISGAD
jgi:hypothetical protein